MTHEELLVQLEELAERLNIRIRTESPKKEDPSAFGGFCRVKDQYRVIVHSRASTGRKIEILTDAVRHFDLDDIYMRPALREYLKQR